MKRIITLVLLAVAMVVLTVSGWTAGRPPATAPVGVAASKTIASTRDVDPRAWTELDIVPMPKNIRLTDNDLILDSDKVVLVIGADACKQSRIGADWINQRIGEVGGEAVLPIIAGTELPADKTLIIIGTVEDNPLIARAVAEKIVDVGPNNPGERGYEIRTAPDGNAIYLAGADNIGALYACVTFGELLAGSGTATRGTATRGTATRGTATRGTATGGTAVWRAAEVRDWPDLIWLEAGGNAVGGNGLPELFALFSNMRNNPNPSPELIDNYNQAIRAHYDHLLRRKFSLIKYYGWRAQGMPFEPIKGVEIVRDGIEYGRERGVEGIIYSEAPYAGRRELYPEMADQRLCPTQRNDRWDKIWIRCWSLDDITRATAHNLAEFIKAGGITHIGLHDTDTGWYNNPAQWEDRCDVCRERWGDDYAAATINKHKIYYEEIKKLNPDAWVHFTFYPYGAPILIPEQAENMFAERFGDTPATRKMARESSAYYQEFWRRLHAAFPVEDVTFCLREAPEDAIQAFREITPGRGLFTWLALMLHPWRPLFSEAAVWSATFIDNPGDIFGVVAYLDGFVPMEAFAVREYSWNKNTPGARPWDRGLSGGDDNLPSSAEYWRHAEPQGEIYDLILPRLARNYFSRSAAPYITRALAENVDLQQIFDRQRRQYTWLTDSESMQWQADNAERGSRAMDELWLKIQASSDRLGLDDFTLRRVINLRERLRMGMWAARARAQNLLARALAKAGDRAGAEAAVARGLDDYRQGVAEKEQLLSERPADPVLEARDRNRWVGLWRQDMADRADLKFIKERLQRTESEIDALSALRTVPEKIINALTARKLSAYRTSASVTVDGTPDEADWQNAMPVETFLILRRDGAPRPAFAHTRARIMYDDHHLYFFIDSRTSSGMVVEDSDMVEIFLQPNDSADYVHFFVDAGDGMRQQFNKVDETDGLRRVIPDNDWLCPDVEHAVRRENEYWTAELKIPVIGFGGHTDTSGWKINIARICPMGGGEFEVSSVQTPVALNLHDMSAYPLLQWTETPWPALLAQIEAPEFKVERMTLPDSVASVATFQLEIKTDRVLHDVKLVAEAYDPEGKLQTRQTLAELDRIMYRWSSPGEYVVEYRQVYQQGGILIKLTGMEGTAERWLRFGGWEGTPQIGSIYDSNH